MKMDNSFWKITRLRSLENLEFYHCSTKLCSIPHWELGIHHFIGWFSTARTWFPFEAWEFKLADLLYVLKPLLDVWNVWIQIVSLTFGSCVCQHFSPEAITGGATGIQCHDVSQHSHGLGPVQTHPHRFVASNFTADVIHWEASSAHVISQFSCKPKTYGLRLHKMQLLMSCRRGWGRCPS